MTPKSDAGESPPPAASAAAGDSEVDDDDGGGRVLEWELGLPSADDLTPLSHSLISPELASAFRISLPTTPTHTILDVHRASHTTVSLLRSFLPSSDDTEPDSPARKLQRTAEDADSPSIRLEASSSKRPRLVWTAQLHKRFVDVVSHLGVGNAVPKTIMQLMNVEGLTRENVASHLQKYRLYLKKGQGIPPEGGGPSLNSMQTAAQEPSIHMMPYAVMPALPPFGSMPQSHDYHGYGTVPFSGHQGGGGDFRGIEQRYHVYGAFGQDWSGEKSFGSMSSYPPRVMPK